MKKSTHDFNGLVDKMKKENHNPLEPVDKQQYKKRYLVRKLEEQEAEEEIKNYHEEEEEPHDPRA